MVVMSYETISRYFTAPGSRLTSVVFRLLRDPPDTVTRNAAFFYNGPLLCLVPAPVYGSGGKKSDESIQKRDGGTIRSLKLPVGLILIS